ncbi:type III-B CRISPR module RAMP protein Cmr1 [Candidatus Desantisbacteria bacterium CG_4_9_14_3_um_filter_40_11]|uniref:Type III-B CRISPR module RAMP protein Cmr1 n=1 Tax=Candidatus Desantisbacteria bacterium CG_4_9_14_3_um_filter_40_11 TaxID=1974546 RepID=A0A2M8ATI9_9BACT|nr:MAG: type III-B CRISPR module RAMP protein Cmr1 [Candidatus Desantisbacteria bacterium CG_4_9_14_3_um_filter_40_11]
MDRLTVTLKIVTPMFLGGADQSPSDGIRPPSGKGVLRFWWRALNWGRFKAKVVDDAVALKKMHDEEKLLFGSAAEEENGKQIGGQGCFLLNVKHGLLTPVQPDFPRFPGRKYLAGMGLDNRAAIPANVEFEIMLRFRRGTDSLLIANIEETLCMIGLFGGFGSRSRRGFGSVVRLIKHGEQLRLPTDIKISAEIEWLKSKFTGIVGISPFSVLDINSLLYRGNDYNTADEAMETVGHQMNLYRTN